jgi:hypothetical protein
MFEEFRRQFGLRGTESILMSSIDRGKDEPKFKPKANAKLENEETKERVAVSIIRPIKDPLDK